MQKQLRRELSQASMGAGDVQPKVCVCGCFKTNKKKKKEEEEEEERKKGNKNQGFFPDGFFSCSLAFFLLLLLYFFPLAGIHEPVQQVLGELDGLGS